MQFAAFEHSLGEAVEKKGITLGHADGFHGEGLVELGPGDRNAIAHPSEEALKAAPQRGFEGRAFHRTEGIPCENEGDEILRSGL